MVRGGFSVGEIREALEDEFGNNTNRIGGLAPSQVTRMINQENNRRDVIGKINAKDFRDRTNLHSLVGCAKGEVIQTRITISWFDEAAGRVRHFGHTTTLKGTGRMMDILNPALQEAVDDAIARGYAAPHITSGMRSGGTTYRLEYVECV